MESMGDSHSVIQSFLDIGFPKRNKVIVYNVITGLIVLIVWLKELRNRRNTQNALKSQKKQKKEEAKQDPCVPCEDKHDEGAVEIDDEMTSFMNKVLTDCWSQIIQFLHLFIKNECEKMLHSIVPPLSSLMLHYVNLGKKALKINGMTMDWTKDRSRLSVDVKFEFHGDVQIRASLAKKLLRFGTKELQLKGRIRIFLEPILDRPPFFGAIAIYFPDEPELQIKFTGLSKLAKPSVINNFVHKKLIELVGMFVVKPFVTCIPVDRNFKVEELNYVRTMNIFRIYILEAEGLSSEDFMPRTLDSYVAVSSAKQRARTRVDANSLNPRWHQAFEMAFNDVPEQEIVFQLFDNRLFKNKLLGSCRISVEEAMKHANLDIWLPLDNAASGRLHIRSQRLNLVSDPAELRKVLLVNQMSQPVQMEEFCSALLNVHVERAKITIGNKIPTTITEINVRNMTKLTAYSSNTTDPVWNQSFSFLIKDPHKENVQFVVKDRYHGSLGSVSIPISRLLEAKNLTITDWFQLRKSALRVRLELRIFVTPLPVASSETKEFNVSSSQQPKHKAVNKPKADPRINMKRRPPLRNKRKKLQKPKRRPKAATGGETTGDIEQPEIRRETDVPTTSRNTEGAGTQETQAKRTIKQKFMEVKRKCLRAIRMVCNR